MKYSSKAALIADCQKEWQRLWEIVDGLDEAQIVERKATGRSAKATRSVKDHLAHLYAWHRMFLKWTQNETPHLPAKGYKWSETRPLNQMLFEKFADEPYVSVRRKLKRSHGQIMKWISGLDENELMKSGHFAWTKKLPLASYVAPNTSGHYRWAIRTIKKSLKS